MTVVSDSFESARRAVDADLLTLVKIATAHANNIAGQRGADLLLRRELAFSETEFLVHFQKAVGNNDQLLAVGTIDGVVFGYGLVTYETLSDHTTLARLDQLLVEAEAREVGVGESIMNLVISEATARGCFGMDSRALPGDRETKNFFESFGLKARQLVVHRVLTPPPDRAP